MSRWLPSATRTKATASAREQWSTFFFFFYHSQLLASPSASIRVSTHDQRPRPPRPTMITTPTKRTKQCRFFALRFLFLLFSSFPCARILHSDLLFFFHLATYILVPGDALLRDPLFCTYIISATHVHTTVLAFLHIPCFAFSRSSAHSRVRNETNRDKCDEGAHASKQCVKISGYFCFFDPLPLPLFLISSWNKILSFFSVSFFCISMRLVLILMFCSFSPWTSSVWVLVLGSKRAKRFFDLVILFPCFFSYFLARAFLICGLSVCDFFFFFSYGLLF